MTTVLLRPQPLPLDGMRPGVGLLVLALHVGLLWVANLYWPLQSVLLGAVHDAAQSMTVRILRKNSEASVSPDKPILIASPQAIGNPGRQRFGRSEVMLELPGAPLEASTPLAATLQAVQTARAALIVPTRPVAEQPRLEQPTETNIETVSQTVPQSVPAAESPQPAVALPAQPASDATAAAAVAISPVPVPVINLGTNTAATSTSTATPSALSGAVSASGAGSGVPSVGSTAAPALPQTIAPSAGAPLNLNLPPRSVYRPPIFVPRRSLSEMANDQLRRKPRDAFAEGIESAGNIDCLKDTPDGPAQGLLAIGPLLKRAIEEKCRK